MIRLPAYFTGFSSRADGSMSLRFNTQEVNSDEVTEMKRSLLSFGWIVFAPQEEALEIPKESISDDTKKPSVRLRAVIYILWQQKGSVGDFDTFYRGRIESIIDNIKLKLQ